MTFKKLAIFMNFSSIITDLKVGNTTNGLWEKPLCTQRHDNLYVTLILVL